MEGKLNSAGWEEDTMTTIKASGANEQHGKAME